MYGERSSKEKEKHNQEQEMNVRAMLIKSVCWSTKPAYPDWGGKGVKKNRNKVVIQGIVIQISTPKEGRKSSRLAHAVDRAGIQGPGRRACLPLTHQTS